MILKESSEQVKIIDTKIDQFANYLQRRNNLDRIQFLKVRLGMQVVVSNIAKFIVTYGLAIIFHIFWYTLTAHLAYVIIRFFAHGAHAKSSILCHVQNIILFVIIPWLMIVFKIDFKIFLIISFFGLIFVWLYAPAETKKHPIPKRLIKRKHVLSIIFYILLMILSIMIVIPYSILILYGITLSAINLLPIFISKEE